MGRALRQWCRERSPGGDTSPERRPVIPSKARDLPSRHPEGLRSRHPEGLRSRHPERSEGSAHRNGGSFGTILSLCLITSFGVTAPSEEPPAGLSHGDWAQIRSAIDEASYRVEPVKRNGGSLELIAPNRHQGYRTTFRREGIEIASKAAVWTRLAAVAGPDGLRLRGRRAAAARGGADGRRRTAWSTGAGR